MGLLWVCREAGTLVHGIGDVWLGTLLEVVELAYNAPVVETLIMRSGIIMESE